MKTAKKILILSVSMMLSPLAKAADGGLFIEPYAAYEMGKGTIDTIAEPDGDLEGFGAGLRFGGHVGDIFFLAVDGMYSMPDFTDEDNDFDFSTKSWLLGPVVGLQTPFAGVRVWAGYYPLGEIELDRDGDSANVTYKEPNIFKVGAGVRISVVSLNLEYLTGTYDKVELKNLGVLSGDYDGEAKRESYLLSVSFPFSL